MADKTKNAHRYSGAVLFGTPLWMSEGGSPRGPFEHRVTNVLPVPPLPGCDLDTRAVLVDDVSQVSSLTSYEDFKKDKGEELTQVLCGKEQADSEAGARVCSLLLAQSEVRAQCLLLVLANRTELSSMFQFMKKHQSDLRKLGIRDFTEQDVASHQSYSRKTLIALVTSGVLLAILGTTGYFLMNRRSWSPTGERLGEDPYSTENGGGQGYSSGPGAAPEAQGKAGVKQGAQNGTGQATSRNGHSARQHVVADTEL